MPSRKKIDLQVKDEVLKNPPLLNKKIDELPSKKEKKSPLLKKNEINSPKKN